MKAKGTNPARITERLVLIGIGLAAVFWIIESAIHVFIFHEGWFIQQISSPKPHEIWMRLLVVTMFIAFAIYAQFIVTQRKQAQQATKVAHAELDQIFQTAADGMRLVDKDFNVLRVNETFATLSGMSKDEAIGKKCYEVFRGTVCHTPDCPLTRILGGEERLEYDAEKERNDGNTVPCIVSATPFREPSGELIGIVEDFKDISERKETEEALLESEKRFRELVDLLPQTVFEMDINGNVTFSNRHGLNSFGYSQEDLDKGLNALQLFVPEDLDRVKENMRIILSGQEPEDNEYTALRKDGSTFPVIVYSSRIISDGKPVGIRGIVLDITERKGLEAQIQHAQKLEAIGTLAGGIAHDFNNLLMGIQGNASLMMMDTDSTHRHYERLRDIENQVHSGARLTSQLLGYARKGKYEIKPIHLNHVVKETSDTFRRTKKEIRIHRELAEDLLAVRADSGQIEQVLWNLYVNAADAMPEGGNLVLETMNTTHKDMKGRLYKPKPGSYVLLRVTDTGTGMNKRTIERIYDPFFTTKERDRGTGLGLASVYGIIKAHEGYIDVDSKKGHGTTFSIYLPASEKRVPKTVKPAEHTVKGTETVLLVDDEESVRRVGRDMLEAMGYTVLLASDGKEAVEVYKENRDDIDVVLLDIVMPIIGGAKAYERLKKVNPDVKVLLLSGYSVDGQAAEILKLGCNGFIQKPFNIKELSGKIRGVLDKQ